MPDVEGVVYLRFYLQCFPSKEVCLHKKQKIRNINNGVMQVQHQWSQRQYYRLLLLQDKLQPRHHGPGPGHQHQGPPPRLHHPHRHLHPLRGRHHPPPPRADQRDSQTVGRQLGISFMCKV